MDYAEIKNLTLSYADRTDPEVVDRFDAFLRIVEARVNRVLKVAEMSIRSTLDFVADQTYYGVPADFGGLRNIESINEEDEKRATLSYLTPEQLNNRGVIGGNNVRGKMYYTLVAQQIQIWPAQDTGSLEITYYQKLVPLSDSNPSNWLSENDPDGYIFGGLVEISSFVKDKETAMLWDARFRTTMEEIDTNDQRSRWSGPPMEVRLG